jgi:hypothetical protein
MDAASCTPYELLGARLHLLRGAAGEGEEENAFGRDTAVDEVRDAINECTGFSRSGAGDDEEWSVTERCRRGLLRIERAR